MAGAAVAGRVPAVTGVGEPGIAERLWRGVKWTLHRVFALGSRERYVAWRARAM